MCPRQHGMPGINERSVSEFRWPRHASLSCCRPEPCGEDKVVEEIRQGVAAQVVSWSSAAHQGTRRNSVTAGDCRHARPLGDVGAGHLSEPCAGPDEQGPPSPPPIRLRGAALTTGRGRPPPEPAPAVTKALATEPGGLSRGLCAFHEWS